MELTSVSAIRGVAPSVVVDAVEAYVDGAGLAPSQAAEEPRNAAVLIAGPRDVWTTVRWPAYFAPHDAAASGRLSRELRAVVSMVTTTEDEGWSHTLWACGTLLDRFHSFPAGLVWDDEDVAELASEWSGDHELVARVVGVDACGVRRHFCQATPATRDHPGRDRDGYLALWHALGIRVPGDDEPPHAVVAVDPAWHRHHTTLTR